MKIEVFDWGSTEENLNDIKNRQQISKEDLEKTVKILAACLKAY